MVAQGLRAFRRGVKTTTVIDILYIEDLVVFYSRCCASNQVFDLQRAEPYANTRFFAFAFHLNVLQTWSIDYSYFLPASFLKSDLQKFLGGAMGMQVKTFELRYLSNKK